MAAPAHTGDVVPLSDIAEEAGVAQQPRLYALDEYRRGRQMSLGDLRTQAAEGLQRRISNWAPRGPALDYDPTALSWRDAATGQFVPQAQGDAFMQSQRRITTIQNAVGEVAQGQGILRTASGLVPAGAAKAAAGVGAAVMLGDRALSFAEDQRAANVEWQRILGGSNAEGFGERMGSRMFQWGRRGLMGGREAEQLYTGAAQVFGSDREARGRVQDLGVELYRDLGMSVDQTMRVVRVAAENGNEQLVGLSESLDTVTEAARTAGRNAEEMRGQWEQTFTALAPQMGAHAGAAAATGISVAEMGLPRALQGVMDATAVFTDPVLQAAMAREMGLRNRNELVAMSSTPEGVADIMQAQQDRATRTLRQYIPPEMREALLAHGVGEGTDSWRNMTDLQRENIVREVAPMMGADFEAMRPMIERSLGYRLPPGFRGQQMFIELASGNYDAAQAVRDTITASDIIPGEASDDPWGRRGRGFGGEMTGLQEEALEAMGISGKDLIKGMTRHSDVREESLQYAQEVGRTGRRDPIIEKLLAAGKAGDDAKFRVMGKDGKERIVNTSELIEHYQAQLGTGQAIIEQAPFGEQGDAVTEALRMATRTDEASMEQASRERESDVGREASEWDKERREGGSGGTVTIRPTGQLAQFLEFLETGNVVVNPDHMRGHPSEGHPTWDQRRG